MKINHYKENLYTFTLFKKPLKSVVIGIDEAGRGPVLGHLVYAAMIAEEINDKFVDSKKLSQSSREAFFKIIDKNYSYAYTSIHPKYLSEKMEKESLNEISYQTVICLIQKIIDSNLYTIKTIYLDALGPINTYQSVLKIKFPKIHFVVENKADSKYPVVSGASIVAKVARDNLLRNWDLPDNHFGSGYTSDEISRNWLKRNFCPVFGFPDIVRFS